MRDGLTVKLDRVAEDDDFRRFAERYRAKLVLVSGPAAGQEFAVDQERQILGRGPGAELAFDDPSMSRQHVAIEFAGDGFRIRDLGSTNGLVVNGQTTAGAELKHGDRLGIGSHGFQYLVEEIDEEPEAYELPAES